MPIYSKLALCVLAPLVGIRHIFEDHWIGRQGKRGALVATSAARASVDFLLPSFNKFGRPGGGAGV